MSDDQQSEIRQLASEIVTAYVSSNPIRSEEVPEFLRQVMAALSSNAVIPTQASAVAATPAPEEAVQSQPATPQLPAEPQKPAVPIADSVRHDAVICLECGAVQKTLKRHLNSSHGLSEADYRAKWHLPKDHPIVAPAYSERRSSMAKSLGLGRKPAANSQPA